MGHFPARFLAGFVGIVVAGSPLVAYAGDGGRADLSVRVTTSPAVAQPGQPIAYHVQVGNAGTGEAVLPVLRLVVPQGVRVVGVDVATCRPGGTPNEVVCPSSQNVPPGGTGAVIVNGIVKPGARGPLRAIAALTAQAPDENEQDNIAAAITEVGEGADLGLRLRGGPRDGGVALAAVVSNKGPHTVRDAYVFFRGPVARLVSTADDRCRRHQGYVACRLRAIRPDGEARVRLMLSPPHQALTARANVFSVQLGDRHPADNKASTRVGAAPAVT
ncbi:hypothetical protein [Nonomuraea sp. NPDC046570]|uniref:hypothetical protein n=1 Tax=Nonomuraea sp. NPDC046570 TaxID=3155255 RepID=UPI0033C446C9